MSIRRITIAMAIALFCLLAGALQISGQSKKDLAGIQGLLSDRSGAVITGAIITAVSTRSGLSWSTITDQNGHFSLINLPAGTFQVDIQQDGFAEQLVSVTTSPGVTSDLPLVLSIAAVVQQINVTASPVNDGLDAGQVRESSARDLGEVTQDIVGVQKTRQAGIASDIAIRGLYHDNLATTFDGARLYGACTGQMDPAAFHVDLSEVSHVDVVKGPFDITTQGALGGYVKVVTKTPDAQGVNLSSNVSVGSYGYYNPSQTVQLGSSSIHFLGGYSFRTSEMYRDGNGTMVSQIANYRNNSQYLQAFRVQSGWTKLALEPSPNQRAEIGYSRQQGDIVLYPNKMMDGVFDYVDRFNARYDWLKPHGVMSAAHAVAYANKVNHLMDNRLRSSSGTFPVSMSAQVVSFADGIRLDFDMVHGVTAGYESYRRYWNSNGSMTMLMMGMPMTTYSSTLPGVTEIVNGGFVAYRKALGQGFLLTTGGRYDYSHSNAPKSPTALYLAYHGTSKTAADDSGLSGNVKVSWQSRSWASLFAGIGSNIRFPDPEERFFISDSAMSTGWVGNPLLTHPRNTEYDFGLTAKEGRYTLSPLVFFSNLNNYITLYAANRMQAVQGVTSMRAQSYANVQAHQWGGELAGSAPLPGGLQLYGSLAYARGTKVPQPGNNIESSNLFQVPPLKSILNLRYEHRYFSSELSGVVTGRQDHIDTDENELRTAGYSVFNFKTGYHMRQINLEAGLNNVLSRQYSEFLSYARNPYTNGIRLPEPGRNFFVSLSYSFARGAR